MKEFLIVWKSPKFFFSPTYYFYFYCLFTFISLKGFQHLKQAMSLSTYRCPTFSIHIASLLKDSSGFFLVHHKSCSLLPILPTPFLASIPDLFLTPRSLLLPLHRCSLFPSAGLCKKTFLSPNPCCCVHWSDLIPSAALEETSV